MSGAPVVTVDGPAGSGKTTLGRRLAVALGLPLIDTGLFYRAVTAAAVRAGVSPDDREAIVDLARHSSIEINTEPNETGWKVRLDGEDLGDLIRDPSHALLLSRVSQIPEVRHHLLPLQREKASRGAVAVGRDCGTVVFPNALVKLYLQASESLRVARRSRELAERGSSLDVRALDAEIARRDLGDAPSMAPAADAVIIDTGRVGIDEMVQMAMELCHAAGLVPASTSDGAPR